MNPWSRLEWMVEDYVTGLRDAASPIAEVRLMAMNLVRFQPGPSLAGFLDRYGAELACGRILPPGALADGPV